MLSLSSVVVSEVVNLDEIDASDEAGSTPHLPRQAVGVQVVDVHSSDVRVAVELKPRERQKKLDHPKFVRPLAEENVTIS